MHLWLFLSVPMQAAVVRRVLERLIALTIADEGLLKLDSFDRIIPCQDELPRGNSSIGNLVALPMQPEAKARGGSSFIRRDARLSFMRQAPHASQDFAKTPRMTGPTRRRQKSAPAAAMAPPAQPMSAIEAWVQTRAAHEGARTDAHVIDARIDAHGNGRARRNGTDDGRLEDQVVERHRKPPEDAEQHDREFRRRPEVP